MLQTAANSTLGVTFNDATTFNLTANARITVDSYVYEDGGKQNGALFDIAKGTVAFVAAAVAKTGDMRISTPTATLGIRGTTGLVEVPEGATPPAANNVAIKLYPDPDGRVGRIEVNDRAARPRFSHPGRQRLYDPARRRWPLRCAPLMITPQQALRDQGIVRQVHAAQSVGRQIVTQRRSSVSRIRTSQSARSNNPRNNNPARQPGLQRQNGLPQQRQGLPNRPGQPGQPRTGLQRQGVQPQACSRARPACCGPDCKTGLRCNGPRIATRPPAPKGKPPAEAEALTWRVMRSMLAHIRARTQRSAEAPHLTRAACGER